MDRGGALRRTPRVAPHVMNGMPVHSVKRAERAPITKIRILTRIAFRGKNTQALTACGGYPFGRTG